MEVKLGRCPVTPFSFRPYEARAVLAPEPGRPLLGPPLRSDDPLHMDYEHDFDDFQTDAWTTGTDAPSYTPAGPLAIGTDEDPHPLGPMDPNWESDEWREEAVSGFQLASSTRVRGRLRHHLNAWTRMGCDREVLDWIRYGYPLPFHRGSRLPSWHCRGNHPGTRTHRDWLASAIRELCTVGAAQKWEGPGAPTIVSPLNVVPKATKGKFRLILDLRFLNSFLSKITFRMETLARSRWTFQQGDWMISGDLQSGYYHLEILPEHWQYMGFEFEGQYYVFCCLPFGLTTAPYAFTRLTRQVVRAWRRRGIRLIHYLDDWLWLARSQPLATRLAILVSGDLASLGFLLNYTKSVLTPVQIIVHLGFHIDTVNMTFGVPTERRDRLMSVATDLLAQSQTQKGWVVARQASRVAGHILSLYLALGPITRMRSRYLYRDIHAAASGLVRWDSLVHLSIQARQDVRFWLESLDHLAPSPIHPPPLRPRHVLYTDAGDEFWGASLYLDSGYFAADARPSHPPPTPARGDLPAPLRAKGSTLRELFAIAEALRVFGPLMRGCHVLIRTDSAAATFLWAKGGSQKMDEKGDLALHEAVMAIDALVRRWDLIPQWEWVPREVNDIADFWSKFRDPGDYRLRPDIFAYLDGRWGPHSVDRMASADNSLLPRFFSRFASVGAEGIDCFSVLDWSSENNFINPDFNLLSRVIEHMQRCGASGTLIIPDWPSAPWWPWLFPGDAPSPVVDRVSLPRDALSPAHDQTILSNSRGHFGLWAVRIAFCGSPAYPPTSLIPS